MEGSKTPLPAPRGSDGDIDGDGATGTTSSSGRESSAAAARTPTTMTATAGAASAQQALDMFASPDGLNGEAIDLDLSFTPTCSNDVTPVADNGAADDGAEPPPPPPPPQFPMPPIDSPPAESIQSDRQQRSPPALDASSTHSDFAEDHLHQPSSHPSHPSHHPLQQPVLHLPPPVGSLSGAGFVVEGPPSLRGGTRRPPRAPQSRLLNQVKVEHRRAISLGDQSYLSVLTEPSMDGTGMGDGTASGGGGGGPNRRRNVSWDFDNSPPGGVAGAGASAGGGGGGAGIVTIEMKPSAGTPRAPPTSILQPILSDDFNGAASGAAAAKAAAAEEERRHGGGGGPTSSLAAPSAVADRAAAAAASSAASQRRTRPAGRDGTVVGGSGRGGGDVVGRADRVGVGAVGASAATTARQVLQNKGGGGGIITLGDIAQSPLEEEAETCIIEALEVLDHQARENETMERQASGGGLRSSSNSTPVMAGLPDEAVPMFADDDTGWRPMMDTMGQAQDINQGKSMVGDGRVFLEESKVNPVDEETGGEEARDRGEENSKSPPPTSPTTTDSREGRKTLKKTRQRTSAVPPPEAKSMRTLAEQLLAMQRGGGSFRDAANSGSDNGGYLKNYGNAKRGLPSHDETDERVGDQSIEVTLGGIDSDAPPANGTDVLVNKANILFRRNKSGRGKSGVESADGFDIEAQTDNEGPGKRKSGSKWNVLRRAVALGNSPNGNDDGDDDNRDGAEDCISNDITDHPSESDSKKEDDQRRATDNERLSPRRKGATRAVAREQRYWAALIKEELEPQKERVLKQLVYIYIGLILPSLFIAALLFYGAQNPMSCYGDHCASISWWIIFLGIRQMLTLQATKVAQFFIIDLFSLRTRVSLKLWGPFITLWIINSKGWPFQATFWAIIDFLVLYGDYQFPKHWLFYQDAIKMCNANNPSGTVTYSEGYVRILAAAMVAGVFTALKRLWLSTYLGTRSCDHYGPQLERLMRELLLISEVANLSKEIEESSKAGVLSYRNLHGEGLNLYGWDLTSVAAATSSDVEEADGTEKKRLSDLQWVGANQGEMKADTGDEEKPRNTDPSVTRSQSDSFALHQSTKLKLYALLGEWEEPEVKNAATRRDTSSSVQDVLQFRQAVSVLDNHYPFSVAFGKASSREDCVDSAQRVYGLLQIMTPGTEILSFETMSLVALDSHGEVDSKKMKALIRLFRPDRSGNLTKIDFVRSIDSVYKRYRLLRANLKNSSQIDRAYENLVNTGFYFVLALICLAILDMNPWPFIASLTGVLVSFAFCFGTAASNYFEGLLLIFVRRPYDIGDRIAVSQVDQDTNPNGSSTWFVEGVTLFATTVRNATTNEVATYSNGSLANSRIINAARSPKAQVYIYLKFSLDVPYDKVIVFKATIEKFVKARPREWIQMSAFRATRVEAELGFVEYSIVLIHRERWQNIGPILNSKADLSSFAVEVQKKLDMRYVAPPMPVQLDMNGNKTDESDHVTQEEGVASNDALNSMAMPELSIFMGEADERKKTR